MGSGARPAAAVLTPERARLWRRFGRMAPNYLFILPYVALFAIFVAGPIIYTLWMSLHDWELFTRNPPFTGLQNYVNLWSDPVWFTALLNTMEFVVVTVTLVVIFALGTALLLSSGLRGQIVFRTIYFSPVILSVSVMAIIWGYLLSTDYGVLNFLLSLVGIPRVEWVSNAHLVIPSLSLATAWWVFGFPMIVFLAGLLNIPGSLYEAARVDGANALQRFLFITVPLLRPTILFVLVTQIIAHFQIFGQSYFISAGGPGQSSYTVIMYLYDTAWRYYRMGYGSAIAVTLAIIMGLVTAVQFLFLGRRTEY